MIILIILFITLIAIDYAYADINYEYISNISYDCYSYTVEEESNEEDYYRYYHANITECNYYDYDFRYKYCYENDYYEYINTITSYRNTDGYDYYCYWYLEITSNNSKSIIYDPYPSANLDYTLYKGDSYNYNVNITFKHIDPSYHPYIEYAYLDYLPSNIQIVNINNELYQLPLNATILTNTNIDYGNYTINGIIEYKVPFYYYYYYNTCTPDQCYSNIYTDTVYLYNYKSIELTSFNLVRYNPRFIAYPYLAISNNNTWSFDKPLILLIHYLGSDNYPLRRAVINDYNYSIFAYKVLEGYDIPIVNNDDIKYYLDLQLDYEPINDTCINNYIINDGIIYLQEGYYAIKFVHNASNIMLDIINYQLADLTFDIKLKSNWREFDDYIIKFNYTYPTRAFNNKIIIRSIEFITNNNIINDTSFKLKPIKYIKAEVNAINVSNAYNYNLKDYLYNKYNYDIYKEYNTYDYELVNKIMCLENLDNYINHIIEVYDAHTLEFNYNYSNIMISKLAFDIFNVNNIYDIPLHYVLTSPSPYELIITVNEPRVGVGTVINRYVLPSYQQYSIYNYTINAQDYNFTNIFINRYNNIIEVLNPRNFGTINYVSVFDDNGFRYINCQIGCSFIVKGNVSVYAINEWYGVGYAVFNNNNNYNDSNDSLIALFYLLLAFIIITLILVFLRKWINEFT